jgi:ABC-2 type transport system ATP-binding protein
MITSDALTKQYGSLTAVAQVSFSVQPGQVLGFLGPNGAGKTTTMRMLAGFLPPSAGTASVCGFDVERQPIQAKARLGYLPEGAPGYGEMTPWRFLEFVADLRGLRGAHKRARLDDVIARLHLENVLDQPIETLSKGFKRRVGLAQAIVHDPPVLILDEPTDGLDPNQKQEVRDLINTMAAHKTVIISTHILEEVDAVCQRVIIIAAGRIVADETPAALAARSRYHNAVSLQLEPVDAARALLSQLPQVAAVEVDPASQRLTAFPQPGQSLFTAVADLVRQQGWTVADLRVETGRLDEVFRAITTGVPA